MSPRRVSIDTSSVVGLFLGRLAAQWPGPEHDLFVSTHVIGELYYGAYRSRDPRSSCAQVADFLSHCTVLRSTDETARLFGKLKADLANRGALIPDNDIWIAAAAIEHNLPLATRDNHFDRIPTLPVLRW
ncbi:MAG: PIN domain-containing protein [Bryobacteraceae bacterium]|nr:PIN domain-containing protein [Bryobacteraceae bacterium]